MKKLIPLLVVLLSLGCVSLPPGLLDFAQEELHSQGIEIKPGDLQKTLEIILSIQQKLPPEWQAASVHLSQLTSVLESFQQAAVTNIFIPPEGALYAGFLLDDAKIRVMNKLSINANAQDYTALLKQLKDFGFNQIPFFLCNEGDGGPVPTTIYKDAWFGTIDQDKVDLMYARIDEAHAMGFAVELWCRADDSPSLDKATPEQIVQMYEDQVRLFASRADSWCAGLEMDEWGKHWWNTLWHSPDMILIQQCVSILKATGKPVGIHLTSYKQIDLAHQSGADRFHAQFSWLKNVQQMTDAMAWINARKGNLEIVASEFNRDSITPLATALATEAMKCGAIGTQTGRPAK